MEFIETIKDYESRLLSLQSYDYTESFTDISEILSGLSVAVKKQAEMYGVSLKELEEKSDILHKKNSSLYARLDKDQKDYDETNAKLDGCKARLRQLGNDVAKAKQDKAREEKSIADMDRKRREAIESWNPIKQLELDNSGIELNRISKLLINATQKFDSLEREQKTYERKVASLSSKIDTLGHDISKNKANLDKCADSINLTRQNLVKCSDAELYFGTMSAKLKYSAANIADILEKLSELKA